VPLSCNWCAVDKINKRKVQSSSSKEIISISSNVSVTSFGALREEN